MLPTFIIPIVIFFNNLKQFIRNLVCRHNTIFIIKRRHILICLADFSRAFTQIFRLWILYMYSVLRILIVLPILTMYLVIKFYLFFFSFVEFTTEDCMNTVLQFPMQMSLESLRVANKYTIVRVLIYSTCWTNIQLIEF